MVCSLSSLPKRCAVVYRGCNDLWLHGCLASFVVFLNQQIAAVRAGDTGDTGEAGPARLLAEGHKLQSLGARARKHPTSNYTKFARSLAWRGYYPVTEDRSQCRVTTISIQWTLDMLPVDRDVFNSPIPSGRSSAVTRMWRVTKLSHVARVTHTRRPHCGFKMMANCPAVRLLMQFTLPRHATVRTRLWSSS